jgi:hypothetical protein
LPGIPSFAGLKLVFCFWQLATVSDFKLSYPNPYLEVPKRACTAEKLRSMGVWAMEGGSQ